MSTKVAINGLGRIGRAILKLVIEEPSIELVAVNDLAEAENLAYLLRFDTVYGRYPKPVVADVSCGRCAPATHWTSPGRSWASSSCSNAPGRSRGVRISRSTCVRARDLSSCRRRRTVKRWKRSSMV
jgi:hypothetical protein